MKYSLFFVIPIIPVRATRDTNTPRINKIVMKSRWPSNLDVKLASVNIQIDIVIAITPASLINFEI